jgi:hypothetical protein
MLIGLVGDDPERLERIAANLRIAASASRARIAETPIQDALIAMEGMPL